MIATAGLQIQNLKNADYLPALHGKLALAVASF
jgi:hypothetical protein